MIGSTIHHYKILARIGQGGMGEVWVAEDTKLGRRVALKTLPSELATDPDRRARFEREARAIAALNHPNIVTIHSVEESQSVAFLTMELVEGKTLAEVLPQNGLPLGRFFDVAIPLASALAAAHQKGIIHRDLKPANVMVTSDGRVKVLDFGLARLAESAPPAARDSMMTATAAITEEGKILGTAAYMSPEQAEGKPVDARSDVFSLGIVMYEMATGQRPFQGDTAISTITSILRDDPVSIGELKPDVPRHLGRLVLRCLAKEPDRRYQTALDVRNELEGLRGEVDSREIGTTTSGSTVRQPPRWSSSRRKILPVAAAVVGVLALVTAGIVLWPRLQAGASHSTATEGSDKKSIAVLPFANMSGDPNNEYFSDGLSEELMNVLARVPGLRVAARTSSFHFKGKTGDVADIGRQLNVATILEGSVRRAGDRVRVTAQLVQADDGFHLWSDTYDRTLDDVFAIQEDIAGRVVEALKIKLLGTGETTLVQRPTQNMEAYDAYLLGQQRLARRRSDALEEAARHFQRAIDLDPRFAQAHAGLAQAYYHQFSYGTLTMTKAREKALPELERALELNPALGEGHALSGIIQWNDGEVEGAEASLRRAIELNPNYPMAFLWYAIMMERRDRGRRDELIQKALALDPLSPVIKRNLGAWLAAEGKTAEAIKQFEHVIEIDPESVIGYQGLADVYANNLDRPEEALELYRKAMELDPGNLGNRITLGWEYFSLGRTDEALKTFQETIGRDAGFARAHAAIARLHESGGRLDEAVRWGRRALERDPDNLGYTDQLVRRFLTLDEEPSARALLEQAEHKHPSSMVVKRTRAAYHMFRGDLKKAEELTREIATTSPPFVYSDATFFDIAAGRPADARARIAAFNKPLLELDDPAVNGGNVGVVIDVCYVLRATGETKRFELLLGNAEAFLASRSPEVRRNLYPWNTFGSLVLRGRVDEALDEAERVVASGSYPTPWSKTDWATNAVAVQPRWQALMTRVRAELEVQRERLAAEGKSAP